MCQLTLSNCAVALLLAAPFPEPYTPPGNVSDVLNRPERQTDLSLPFVYLEPHQFCYDKAGPLEISLFVVNRSNQPQTIDWAAWTRGLILLTVAR